MTSIYNADFWLNVLAGLLTAALLGTAGFLFGRMRRDAYYRRKLRNAPERYLEELTKQITIAVEEGPKNAIVNALAVISIRNTISKNFAIMYSEFNSDLSRVASNLVEYDQHRTIQNIMISALTEHFPSQNEIEERIRDKASQEVRLPTKGEATESTEVSRFDEELRVFREKVYADLCVLEKSWKVKKKQIEVDIKRLIYELGFEPYI